MSNINQKTLAGKACFEGIGLHTGLFSKVTLIPAMENTGIIFKRIDLKSNNEIEANFKNVSSAKLCTTLENNFGNSVSTVEHLMAAFYITGIDNVVVEINNSEIPIMDGSSKDFVELINKVGTKELFAKRKFLKINKKVKFSENEKEISIEPNSKNLEVKFELSYNNEIIGNQKNNIRLEGDLKDVYSSRTFCLYEDVEKIKENGLAKGGSLENAVVVKGEKVLNNGGLRNEKEFVNHKILDLVGDFFLSGYRILGTVKCVQGGHYLTNKFLREIFKNESNFANANQENPQLIKKNFKSSIKKLAVNA